MPEIAEAHTMADQLKIAVGYDIVVIDVYSDSPNKFQNIHLAKGQSIINVFAIGKHVIFQLVDGFIYTTLSMTGKWLLKSDNLLKYQDYFKLRLGYGRREGRVTRVKGYMYFADPRTWGNVRYLNHDEYNVEISKLGPDPLNNELQLDYWRGMITKKSIGGRHVVDFLNDQKILSGLGNWLRAEILYEARIHPFYPISELNEEQIDNLFSAVFTVVTGAYTHQGHSMGTDVGNYCDCYGNFGTYPTSVFGKSVCPFGHIISKEKCKGNQTVHHCSICQV